MESNYETFIDFAKTLAHASGELIKKYFYQGVTAENKADNSPVTIADREAEQLMRQMITAKYPDHGIIGEEYGAYQEDAPYQWILDPIDGTRNFVCGSFLFGTLIALMHHGKPVIGALHHPLVGQLVIGDGEHTRLNDKQVKIRPCDRLADATICSTVHFEIRNYHDFAAYERLITQCQTYRTWGDCHGYYLLTTGGIDIMVDPIMHLWDIAPLVPIVQGAGGIVTDWSGGDPLSGNGLIAASKAIHSEIVRILNPSV